MFKNHVLVLPAAILVAFLVACSGSITDAQGRTLPALGTTATLVDKHGWLATSEAAVAELMTLPKINLLATPPEQGAKMFDQALAQNADRLIHEGKVIQVTPGAKGRVLGYFTGESRDIRPISPGESVAKWVKVEVQEPDGKQPTGFTTADSIE